MKTRREGAQGLMLLEPWRIELFGGLKLRQGDRLITRFPTQKASSLLAYLALHADRVHPREQLADLLWPDSDVDSARHSLRQALLSLRRILEPPGVPPNTVLVADRANVRLDSSAVETDVAYFLRGLKCARDSDDSEERVRNLADACAQYAGPLLPGVYEEWADAERERFAELYRRALVALSREQAGAGDISSSVESLRRAAVADSLDAVVRGELIRRLVEVGRSADARRELEDARRVWRSELDEDLPAQLLSLEESLPDSPSRPLAQSAPGRKQAVVATVLEEVKRVRLPLGLTRFFGRQEEIGRIQSLLDPDSPVRLVTLTGPGGAGKTRTAVESARGLGERFDSAVWFVPLADILEPRLIPDAMLSALGLEQPFGSAMDHVIRFLRDRTALVLLDNVEHLIDGASEVTRELVESCASLRVLATSRQALGIPGEQELPLSPLATPGRPGTPQRLLEFPSVELFVDRARQVRPDFQITANNAESVAALCERLEGIPLAIELAAARASVLTPTQMLEELKDRFTFLTGRGRALPERHRTLRAVLESSVDALEGPLKRTFARLSVFRGGWTIESAREVCGDDKPLESQEELRRRSLITAEERGGDMRFSMLETIREYGDSALSPEESSELRRRHAEYFAGMAQQFWEGANSAGEDELTRRVAADHDNVRAALAWLLEEDPSRALEVCANLQRFWYVRGHFEEAQRRTELALDRTDGEVDVTRSRAFNSAGVMARDRGELRTAAAHCGRAREMALELGELRVAATARHNLGLIAMDSGEYAEAIEHSEAALKEIQALGAPGTDAHTLNLLGLAHLELANLELAESYCRRALEAARVFNNAWTIGTVLNTIGNVLAYRGQREEAEAMLAESLRIAREIDNRRGTALSLYNLGMIARSAGDVESARPLFNEALSIFESIGDQASVAFTLEGIGLLLEVAGSDADSARLLGAADSQRSALSSVRPPVDQPAYDTVVGRLRSRLGESRLEALRAAGGLLSPRQAVDLARESLSSLDVNPLTPSMRSV